MADTADTGDTTQHLCGSCGKTYPRRDLLLRHRRRCQGLKPRTRRKACNACVQAKARCTYTRPCGRCAQRGSPCEYAQPPDEQDPGPRLSVSGGNPSPFHLSPALPGPISDQPLDVEAVMQGVPDAIDPLAFLDFPVADLDPIDANPRVQYSLQHLAHLALVLQQYPKALLQDDFASPFLHRSLYDEDVPDMTTLAKTSMAVCCASAMETADGARFARRAMDVERQRLIQSYPSYLCMQQWDALHAMLLYGILELRPSLSPQQDEWKQKSYSKGLKDPFLAKMTQSFIQTYLNTPGFDLLSTSESSQTWEQWAVSETARRTIFLANLLHFLSNHDLKTGKPSLYYEPLDEDLICNMPLPCSHALWTARTEQDWRLTMEYCQNNASPTTDLPSAFHLGSGCFSLQYLLTNFSSDYLQAMMVQNFGFGGSDQLRSFIILCALKQFG